MTSVFRLLAACCLIASLSACETPRDPVADTEGIPDAPPATFEETEAALHQGALSYPQHAWLSNIDSWLTRLDGFDVAHRDDLVRTLREVRSEVQREPLDVQRLADLLDRLGDYTRAAGEDAGEPRAERLGQALNDEAARMRAEVAGPPGLPARPARPGGPGAAEPDEPDEVIDRPQTDR